MSKRTAMEWIKKLWIFLAGKPLTQEEIDAKLSRAISDDWRKRFMADNRHANPCVECPFEREPMERANWFNTGYTHNPAYLREIGNGFTVCKQPRLTRKSK